MSTSESQQNDNDDPYAYLNRDKFTSEKFKIEIRGLPKYYGISELKKFLNKKLKLEACKVKPTNQSHDKRRLVFVSFRNEENRRRAIAVINETEWKNSQLVAKEAKPAPDPYVKRQMQKRIDSPSSNIVTDEGEMQKAAVLDIQQSTIPLRDIPYPQQLEQKQEKMHKILTNLGKEMRKANKSDDTGSEANKRETLNNVLPCELLPIIGASVTEGYRNKCEFTIGRCRVSNRPMIGFRLCSYVTGSTAVGPIDDLCHVPERMKSAAKIFNEFIVKSELEPFNPIDHSGYWNQVTMRTSLSDELMVMVAMCSQGLSSEKLDEIKMQLKDFFETGEGVNARVTSLYFQVVEKNHVSEEDSSEASALFHLGGTKYITETLLGMKFRVSPEAFFQVNSLAAEGLYKAALELAKPTPESAVLDVCCGTGTIGISFSTHCGEVFGMEVVENAIKDAKENVIANEITNCNFFVGKAEDILSAVIRRITQKEIIAVVDPPRAGLHQRALLALRKAERLTRLIYISCDPQSAFKNMVDLVRPASKHFPGERFVPVKAVPVDMFPHTRHCELIVCFERESLAIKD